MFLYKNMANVKPNVIGDPYARKHAAVSRLRQQLRKKRESLADHFEFKMYITFHFKDKENAYSYESSKELLEKDVVQLHAPRWQCMRKDVIGCTSEMDFFLWPRNDIEKIECKVFSKWKGDDAPFKPVQDQLTLWGPGTREEFIQQYLK
ncbi:hypothetical protein KUTeg_016927 [Tegillarca granosa]|uniref:Uncharacterized protein n=1 Tax=Tegillarca granosa TaxID=220873 RepID=A0ABQ9EM96_TEGGR|nr:hypothetical protein KUTeg_016927 [Tegillarca granosa]